MLLKIVLSTSLAVALALPVSASLLNGPGVFFDFTATQGQNPGSFVSQRPQALAAGELLLTPSLSTLIFDGDRRVRIGDRRGRENTLLRVGFRDNDRIVMREGDEKFRGKFRPLGRNQRKLAIFLDPPDGRRFVATALRAAAEVNDIDAVVMEDQDLRVKVNSNGSRAKVRGNVYFLAYRNGEAERGNVRIRLSVDLD